MFGPFLLRASLRSALHPVYWWTVGQEERLYYLCGVLRTPSGFVSDGDV
jgi:hypothetical protein